MLTQQLLDRLRETSPLRPASCFVLLWTWFERIDLGAVENTIREDGKHPFKLEGWDEDGFGPGGLQRTVQRLVELENQRPALNKLALRWLKGLDRIPAED